MICRKGIFYILHIYSLCLLYNASYSPGNKRNGLNVIANNVTLK